MSLLAEGDYLQRSSSFSIYLLYLRNAIEIITNFCDILDFYAEVLSWIPGMSVLTKVLGSKLWPVSKPLFQWILLTPSAMSIITDDITEGGSAILGASFSFHQRCFHAFKEGPYSKRTWIKTTIYLKAFSKHFFWIWCLLAAILLKWSPRYWMGSITSAYSCLQ